MNLFVIYIGGAHEKSFIELHDMRFVIANSIEETHQRLKETWWGIPESLHLDAWGILKYVDSYEIVLKNIPQDNEPNRLYFVNLGGYDKNEFTELHKNIFVVEENESKAKVKALKQILHWESHHRDYQFEIEKIIDIIDVIKAENLYIHLVPTTKVEPFKFICKYVPIGK